MISVNNLMNKLGGADKVLHFLLAFFLTVVLSTFIPIVMVSLIVAMLCFMKEHIDKVEYEMTYDVHIDYDWKDFTAGILGLLVGIGYGVLVNHTGIMLIG